MGIKKLCNLLVSVHRQYNLSLCMHDAQSKIDDPPIKNRNTAGITVETSFEHTVQKRIQIAHLRPMTIATEMLQKHSDHFLAVRE